MVNAIRQFLLNNGFSKNLASALANMTTVSMVVLLCIASWILARIILTRIIGVYVKRSRSKWDDIILERRFFSRAAHLAPAVVLYFSASGFPAVQAWIQKLAQTYIIIVTTLIIFSLLDGFDEIYSTFEISKEKPIKGIIQVLKIIISIIAAIITISLLVDKSPWVLLSGIGVFSAVLMLVFQNSILGFVAGIQLSSNDMVRVGDWIEMPRYDADGEIIEITLHTVKVQNWDKSITMIPSHALISESFKNWRGMRESGGRRIKETIYIDVNSIKTCTDEMLQRLEKLHYLSGYINSRRGNNEPITNIGAFRAYVEEYMQNLPGLNKGMTMMVRQHAPAEHGLPIEIYCFSAGTRLADYEAVKTQIFDHIMAIIHQFDLRIYQRLSGLDLAATAAAYNPPGRKQSD